MPRLPVSRCNELFTDTNGRCSIYKVGYAISIIPLNAAFLWQAYHFPLTWDIIAAFGAVTAAPDQVRKLIMQRFKAKAGKSE